MKTFVKKDIRSILFILALTLFGLTLAYLIISDLSDNSILGLLLLLISTLLTAIGIGVSIHKDRTSNE